MIEAVTHKTFSDSDGSSSNKTEGPRNPVPPHVNSVLEIDLKAIGNNYRKLCEMQGKGEIAPVMKANAYGIGIDRVAPSLYTQGARKFFVAHIEEGMKVRSLLPDAEIYVFNGVYEGTEEYFVEHNLVPCLISRSQVERFQAFCKKTEQKLPSVFYFDTGFARTGMNETDCNYLRENQDTFNHLHLKGIMSHLACSRMSDDWRNPAQKEKFDRFVKGFKPEFKSLANSGGLSLGYTYDVSRPGRSLYGSGLRLNMGMQQAVKLWARILQVQRVPAGTTVGYEGTYITPRDSVLATFGVGYADSWFKGPQNPGVAVVGGHRVPFVGLVNMDLTVVDVTDIMDKHQPKEGDWAQIVGDELPLDDVEKISRTAFNKIITSFGQRHHRIYHKE